MMSGGGLLPCVGRHPLRPGDGVESPRQGQALHDLERDQRLHVASSEARCLVSGQIEGTHQSELGAKRESLRRPHGDIVRAKIHFRTKCEGRRHERDGWVAGKVQQD